MARVTITIEDQEDGKLYTKLESTPELPDQEENASIAQIVGVGTYQHMRERLDVAKQLIDVFSQIGDAIKDGFGAENLEALKNAPLV